MKRRDFIALAGAAAAFPRVAFAQQATKVPRVAYLQTPHPKFQVDGLFKGLADRGYTDGKNINVEFFTAPTASDLPAFAAKAVASNPDLILAYGAAATLPAAQLTKTIPIVFYILSDPVASGLVSNFAHPDGNVTGAGGTNSVSAAKEFGFLKEMMPNLSRVAFFGQSTIPTDAPQRSDVLAAGKATGIDIVVIDVANPRDFRPYFAQAIAAGAQAVYFGSYNYLSATVDWKVLNELSMGQRQQPTYNAAFIAGSNGLPTAQIVLNYLALLNGLPAISGGVYPPGISGGDLFGYGESATEGLRRAAHYVDEILRGSKPGDMPVDLPVKYEFSINFATAKALGLIIPPDVLLLATQVVE